MSPFKFAKKYCSFEHTSLSLNKFWFKIRNLGLNVIDYLSMRRSKDTTLVFSEKTCSETKPHIPLCNFGLAVLILTSLHSSD